MQRSDVPARMLHFMELSGLTRARVAGDLGVTRGAVTHWLAGRRDPTLDNLAKFAALCGVSLETLFAPLPTLRRKKAS